MINLVSILLSGSPTDDRYFDTGALGGKRTTSGEIVSERTALTVSAVFACVRNIAEDTAKLPLITYQRINPEGKRRAIETPIYKLLHNDPNPEMCALDFRQAVSACAILYGNGYAEIERNTVGDAVALWPLESWLMRPARSASGELFYQYTPPNCGQAIPLPANDVIHLRGFSLNGVVGEMVSKLGSESIGMAKAAERFAASWFGNGAYAGVVLRHPGKLSQEAKVRLKEGWEAAHRGAGRAHGTAVLEDGMDVSKLTVDPEQSQALEMRQFQIEDLCRWFRMPPHKVQQLLRSTFANIEHQGIEYVTDTLLTWLVRWEQELNRKVVQAYDPTLFVEHLLDMLMRGDALSRSQALQTQFQNGALTLDEWRSLENRNPLPDGWGKKHFVAVNLRPIDSPAPSSPAPVGSERKASLELTKKALARIFAAAVARALGKETLAVKRSAAKFTDRQAFEGWTVPFYSEHGQQLEQNLTEPALALADLLDQDAGPAHGLALSVIKAYVGKHVAESMSDLYANYPKFDAVLEQWSVTRPSAAAETITNQIALAIQNRRKS